MGSLPCLFKNWEYAEMNCCAYIMNENESASAQIIACKVSLISAPIIFPFRWIAPCAGLVVVGCFSIALPLVPIVVVCSPRPPLSRKRHKFGHFGSLLSSCADFRRPRLYPRRFRSRPTIRTQSSSQLQRDRRTITYIHIANGNATHDCDKRLRRTNS